MAKRSRRRHDAPDPLAQRWATGETLTSDEAGGLELFTPGERLDDAWRAEHGQTLGEWLAERPEQWEPGPVELNDVMVFYLNAEQVEQLRAGAILRPLQWVTR